ncbi:hypothetical protein [Microcoleus sp. D2_18a_D3]
MFSRSRDGYAPAYAYEMAISSFLDEESFSFEDCLLAKRMKDTV